jgi:hypothetical protein
VKGLPAEDATTGRKFTKIKNPLNFKRCFPLIVFLLLPLEVQGTVGFLNGGSARRKAAV